LGFRNIWIRSCATDTLLLLLLAGIVAFVLIKVSGRQPVAKISAVKPFRHNIVSSITSNGKVEPIAPFNISRGSIPSSKRSASAKGRM